MIILGQKKSQAADGGFPGPRLIEKPMFFIIIT